MGTVLGSVRPIPDALREMCGQSPEKDPRREIPACDLDNPQSIQGAIKYAISAEPSIQGQGGDTNAIRVVCRMRDLGVSETTCLEILLDHWNPRCEPPWNFEELETKVGNGYRYARNQAGCDAPIDLVEMFPDLDGPTAPAKDKPEPFSIHDLQGDPPDREWIIKDWLPVGEVSSLYGDGGIGKTLLAKQIGFCVSYGLNCLGLPVRQMPVFAALAEDDRNEVHRRISNFRQFYFVDPEETDSVFQIFAYPSEDYCLVHVDRSEKLTPGPFYRRLVSFLKSMPEGPKLVILDTLADMFDGNENVRGQVNFFVKNVLRGLCVKYNATVLLLAHPSRSGMASEDHLSGSTAWNNAVRNRLTLTAHKVLPEIRNLTRVKSNYAKSGEIITLCWQSGVFARADEEALIQQTTDEHEQMILEVLGCAVDLGCPYGDTRNHGNQIYKNLEAFKDTNGKPLKKDLLKTIIEGMKKRGLIEQKKNDFRGNGLYPV